MAIGEVEAMGGVSERDLSFSGAEVRVKPPQESGTLWVL